MFPSNRHLWTVPTMGDIGIEQPLREYEPIPESEPVTEPAVAPEPEKVPA